MPNPPDLLNLLDAWRPTRIVVAGDLMLDRTLLGEAERLSPDAPVPVLSQKQEKSAPGGAANVALNLLKLRCKVTLLGVIGDDEPGQTLTAQLKEAGCNTACVLADPDRPTTIKTSLVGLAQHRHPQKMFRLDHESRAPLSANTRDQLLAKAEKALQKADALILEDYQKGVLTGTGPHTFCKSLIRLAKRLGVPVLVDPAATDDFSRYAGATCITPNRTEAELAVGERMETDDALAAGARRLKSQLKLDTVVLTLDRQGAMLLEGRKKPVMIPTRARSVYDVTGAGDMVVAALAAARANGAAWPLAVALANVAAGLEVERFGVCPIELDELLLAVLTEQHAALGKQRTLDQLTPELAALRRSGKSIVFTNGCFDILHAGHVALLSEAKAQGDVLVVATNSDASIRKLKGKDRPVNQESDRVDVLSALEAVDYVIVYSDDKPLKLLRAIKPNVLVKGGEYTIEQVVGHEIVTGGGGRIHRAGMIKGRSTTNIISKARG